LFAGSSLDNACSVRSFAAKERRASAWQCSRQRRSREGATRDKANACQGSPTGEQGGPHRGHRGKRQRAPEGTRGHQGAPGGPRGMQGSQGGPGTVGARPLRLCFTAVSHSRYHLPFYLLPVGRLVWGKTGLGVLEVWIKGLALTLRVGHVLYLILLHLLHPRPNACLLQMHDVACGVHKRAVVLFLGCMQCMSTLTSFMVVESSVFHMPRAWPFPFFGFIFHVSFCGCSKMLSFWL
jgi:hypothetical protein